MSDLQIEPLKSFLVNHLSPDMIYLFGSFSEQRVRPDSDIDLAFLSTKAYDDYEIFILAQKLADIAGRDVDLIQLRKASTVFQAEIISSGKTIYCQDETIKDEFEMLTFKKYAKLNEERKPILDQIKERGTIYGE